MQNGSAAIPVSLGALDPLNVAFLAHGTCYSFQWPPKAIPEGEVGAVLAVVCGVECEVMVVQLHFHLWLNQIGKNQLHEATLYEY